jgi:hypothetical protein
MPITLIMTDRHTVRRRLLTATYWVGGAGIIAVCLVLGTTSLQDSDSYGSIVSALIGLGTCFAGIVAYLRRGRRAPRPDDADLVATLLGFWEPELQDRRTTPSGEPRTIPLRWQGADVDFGAAPAAVVGGKGLGEVRLKLDGALDENPDDAAHALATRFDGLPGSKRLVVLGEPGAGKTFLAITLAVGLLRRWSPGDPVAVFLSLAAWDPVVEGLDEWMTREIAALYCGGRVEVATDLLLRRGVLPILDGLDELPEHLRRPAVTRINHTLDGNRPIVLTCRTAEYEAELAGGAPRLHRAAVVRVLPLAVADILAYLARDDAWADFADHVRQHGDSPVAAALSTPLVLSLFGSVYHGRSPDDLLTGPHLTTRHEVEDHIVDGLLESAYPGAAARPGAWTAKKARRWLTYLAEHLHERKVRDLSSWQMAHDLIGLTPAVVIGAVPVLLYLLWGEAVEVVAFWMVVVPGVAMMIAEERRVPGRGVARGDGVDRAETFGFGVTVGTAALMFAGVGGFAFTFLASGREYDDIVEVTAAIAGTTAVAIVSGLGFGLNELMAAAVLARGSAKAGGRDFLVRDRSSALRASLMAAVFVGVVAVPFATIAAAYGAYAGQRLAALFGEPAILELDVPALDAHVPWGVTWLGADGLLMTGLWMGVAFAFAVLLTRSWTWLVVLRVTRAVSRRLPWRLMRFLEDARGRGLLRGAGGYYQFGHIRLQERLVATAATREHESEITKIVVGLVVAVSIVLAGGTAVTLAGDPSDCADVGWSGPEVRVKSVVAEGSTGCFAHLGDDWGALRAMPADPAKLAELRAMQPTVGDVEFHRAVFVVGALDGLSSTGWKRLLDGVIAAQKAADTHFRVVFALAEVADADEADTVALTGRYITSVAHEVGAATATVAAVHVDTAASSPADAWPTVIGLRSGELDEVVAERAAADATTWLQTVVPVVKPRSFVDGVSTGECSSLAGADKTYAPGRYDLRGAGDATEVLADIAHCGPANVLVDSATADAVRRGPDAFSALSIVRTTNVPQTFRPACGDQVSPGAHPDVTRNCVVTTAAVHMIGALLTEVRAGGA